MVSHGYSCCRLTCATGFTRKHSVFFWTKAWFCSEGQANGAQGNYQKYMSDFQQYMKGQGGNYQKLSFRKPVFRCFQTLFFGDDFYVSPTLKGSLAVIASWK